MSSSTLPLFLLALIALLLLLLVAVLRVGGGKGKRECNEGGRKRQKILPPGPRRLPILGNLHMLGALPHRSLQRLAADYGPIMYMHLGVVPTVVVSSPHAAEQFLKTHDASFASRPITDTGKYLSYGLKGIAFSDYGPYWRGVRKLCTSELLCGAKINAMSTMRREELSVLVQSLKDIAEAGGVANISAMVGSLSASITCRMVIGKKYADGDLDKRGFAAVVHEGMRLAGAFNIGDFIPYVAALDLQGLRRDMKAFNKVFDDFFEKIIDEHVKERREGKKQHDFIDVMLSLMDSENTEFPVTRTSIKAVMLDMITGSMDTSSSIIEWAMSELLRHPRVKNKVQEELMKVVGKERMVEESDLASLEYLDMVVKETLRLHPVAPLLVPHQATEECTIDGFCIPKKCRVIINGWAIGRDPTTWPRAEEFYPERFDGSDIDIRGRHFQVIPFGSGRRGCPGMQLGLTVFRLVLAQLMHCFDWELPNGLWPTELDMNEKFSLVVARAQPLLAAPTYRLSS